MSDEYTYGQTHASWALWDETEPRGRDIPPKSPITHVTPRFGGATYPRIVDPATTLLDLYDLLEIPDDGGVAELDFRGAGPGSLGRSTPRLPPRPPQDGDPAGDGQLDRFADAVALRLGETLERMIGRVLDHVNRGDDRLNKMLDRQQANFERTLELQLAAVQHVHTSNTQAQMTAWEAMMGGIRVQTDAAQQIAAAQRDHTRDLARATGARAAGAAVQQTAMLDFLKSMAASLGPEGIKQVIGEFTGNREKGQWFDLLRDVVDKLGFGDEVLDVEDAGE